MESAGSPRSAISTLIRVLAIAIVVAAFFSALVLRTGEENLVPCSVMTEFTPCGHRTDYRIPLRIGVVALGVFVAVVLFRFARRVDQSQLES